MKLTLAILLTSFNLLASTPGIICRDDQRMNQGSLRELVLTPADGGYLLQSQFIPSLHSPDIKISNWAEKLACRLDEKTAVAYCQNQGGETVVQFTERRLAFFDSLEEEKKVSAKYTDIVYRENGVDKKTETFTANHCQVFGGEN